MDKIQRALAKLSKKERSAVSGVLNTVLSGDTKRLDIKKLKGFSDVYRIRKGTIRIIFRRNDSEVTVLSVEKRSDTTY